MSRLRGRVVLVTRPPESGPELGERLAAEGAEVVERATLAIGPPDDLAALDAAIAELAAADAIVFTSRNGAERFLARAEALGRAIPPRRWAVGAKTAEWIEGRIGGRVEFPADYRAETLLARLAEAGEIAGRRYLLVRAPEGREELAAGLRAGGAEVREALAYRIVDAAPFDERERAALARVDTFTFLSGRSLEAFLRVVPEAEARVHLSRGLVAVIGPVAAAAAARLGIRVDVVPATATAAGLVLALVERAQSR